MKCPENGFDRKILNLLIIFVVIIGILARVINLTNIEFRHDSAFWSHEAHQILQGGYYPLIGQQVGSVNVRLYNGPLLSYLTSMVFIIVGEKPEFVAGFIAILNVLGIYLTYLIGKRLYSPRVGIMSAVMISIAPWLILYGRMLWPQSIYPFLIPLSIYILLKAIESEKFYYYLLYGFILGVGLQLHLSVLAIIGTGGIILLIYASKKIRIMLYVLGILLGYLPIIIYDLVNGFTNIFGLLSILQHHSGDESSLFNMIKTIWNFTNILSGQALWVSKLSSKPFIPLIIDWSQGIIYTFLFVISFLIIILGLLINIKSEKVRNILPVREGILLLFIILPIIYLLFSQSLIQRHYFIFFYPIPFLIISRGIELWTIKTKQRGKSLIFQSIPVFLLIIAVALNIVTIIYMGVFINKGGEGEYGIILEDKIEAAKYILNNSNKNYSVDLTLVQEPTPYVFLFEIENNIFINNNSVSSGIKPDNYYKIVELPYHKYTISENEFILARFRNVLVIGLTQWK